MSDEVKGQVRKRYAAAALAIQQTEQGSTASCCESSCCGSDTAADTLTGMQARQTDAASSCCAPSCCSSESAALQVDLTGGSYSAEELQELPQDATTASLGCGNPVALATLSPGDVVLDLGSGGGIDVLLSARRVAPDGKAYGLDMTDEMLALAHKNKQEAGIQNAEFLKEDRGYSAA